MSWTRDITLWCDHDGCPEWIMGDALDYRTVAATRRFAFRAGWRFVGGKDYCAIHTPDGSQ